MLGGGLLAFRGHGGDLKQELFGNGPMIGLRAERLVDLEFPGGKRAVLREWGFVLRERLGGWRLRSGRCGERFRYLRGDCGGIGGRLVGRNRTQGVPCEQSQDGQRDEEKDVFGAHCQR